MDFRVHAFLPLVALGSFLLLPTSSPAAPDHQREGRFLYCGDDDWDWASPLGAEKPSKLSTYGKMPWSALDWIEEGLEEVRGVLLGTTPVIGDYLVIEGLSALRGENATYRNITLEQDDVAGVLAADPPPNVLIIMRDSNRDKGGRLEKDDVPELTNFVNKGGRLLVLDDWSIYLPVLEAMVASSLDAHAANPIPAGDAPDPALLRNIRRLVKQLGADEFQAREDASAELLKLGRDCIQLAAEIAAEHHPGNPEIKDRITKLRHHFDAPTVKGNDDKHERANELVRATAARLRAAGAPCETPTALVNAKGDPLACLKLHFPPR